VALVERQALGGDCLWTGCVPSKALIASARLAHRMRHAERLGLSGAAPAHVFAQVMERMRRARDRVALHDDPQRFRDLGVEVVFGVAHLAAPNRVAVDGRILESSRIVVATGAVPAIPPILGLDEAGYLTYASAFEQETLPSRIVLLGGGPIGIEFAQVYRRLGADVTLVEMLPQLLPREEPEAGAELQRTLEAEGVVVHVGARVERVERSESGAKLVRARKQDGAETVISADEIFVATGRRANTAGLGLEPVGVEVSHGAVVVDGALRTTVRGIWAAGDVAGGPQFTHVAEYQAKLVLRNAVFPFTSKVSYATVPAVTYTDPEVARVGLTEVEARERRDRVAVHRYAFADLDRAIVDGHDSGFVKVVTQPNGKILGATVVAAGAGDLIMPLVLAMRHRIPLPKLSRLVYPYPTMVEGIKRTADGYYREKLGGHAGRWLRRIVRVLR
jgi:pyruvate/2-oxoglutarate dehydrogenase complex dihydrolipoamide dehydrogenase (E3) component